MKVTKTFYNVECDCCGELLNPEGWCQEQDSLRFVARESNWKNLGGKDYCPGCWNIDDDDNLVTMDGRRFAEDGKEIKTYRMSYIEVGEWMTLTQFRTEMERMRVLFDCMVGTTYKQMLAEDLCKGWDWFGELLVQRKGTPEHNRYNTFLRHDIFRRVREKAYERMYHTEK